MTSSRDCRGLFLIIGLVLMVKVRVGQLFSKPEKIGGPDAIPKYTWPKNTLSTPTPLSANPTVCFNYNS